MTGTVKPLAGVAEIAKTSNSSSEAHYYDNVPAVVVQSTGSDEITITASAVPLDVLADITGQVYDSCNRHLPIEGERTQKYFAIGYKTQATNGDEYYVWRLKGSFSVPDQTNATKDDGTDANGQELTFTGISTTHKFTKGQRTGNGCYRQHSTGSDRKQGSVLQFRTDTGQHHCQSIKVSLTLHTGITGRTATSRDVSEHNQRGYQ